LKPVVLVLVGIGLFTMPILIGSILDMLGFDNKTELIFVTVITALTVMIIILITRKRRSN